MSIRLGACGAVAAFLLLGSPAAAQEPKWWTDQKKACGIPPGTAYNDWNGVCNSGGSTSRGSTNRSSAPSPSQQATAIYNRGLDAEKRGDLEGALALYEEAAKIWPGDAINKSLQKTRTTVGAMREQQRQQTALNNAIKESARSKLPPAATTSSGLQFQGATARKTQSAAALEFMPSAPPVTRGSSTTVRSGSADAPALQFMPGEGGAKQQLGSASVSSGRATAGTGLDDHQGLSGTGSGGPVLQATGAGEGRSKEARLGFDTVGRAETPAPVYVPTPPPSIDPVVPASLKSNPKVVEWEGKRAAARKEIAKLEDERKTLNRSNPKDQARMSVIDDTVQRQQKVVLFANDEIQKVVKIAGAPIIVDDEEPAKPGAAAPSGAQGAGPGQ